jgi:hypothetical protein
MALSADLGEGQRESSRFGSLEMCSFSALLETAAN